jgi:competence protein ComGC
MKKILIIVSIILIVAIVIFAVPTLIKKSKPALESGIATAHYKAKQAGLKAFVATTISDMAKSYSDGTIKSGYDKNPEKKKELEAKLAELKSKNDGEFEYKIYDIPEGNTAVKAADLSENIYVCIDSLTVKSMDISADEFNKATDCAGKPLE